MTSGDEQQLLLHVEMIDIARNLALLARDVIEQAATGRPSTSTLVVIEELRRELERNAANLTSAVRPSRHRRNKVIPLPKPKPDVVEPRQRTTASGSIGEKEPAS